MWDWVFVLRTLVILSQALPLVQSVTVRKSMSYKTMANSAMIQQFSEEEEVLRGKAQMSAIGHLVISHM